MVVVAGIVVVTEVGSGPLLKWMS